VRDDVHIWDRVVAGDARGNKKGVACGPLLIFRSAGESLRGFQWLLLWLCSADPVKLIVPFFPLSPSASGYSALPYIISAYETTGE
jgi:hypothetical protein